MQDRIWILNMLYVVSGILTNLQRFKSTKSTKSPNPSGMVPSRPLASENEQFIVKTKESNISQMQYSSSIRYNKLCWYAANGILTDLLRDRCVTFLSPLHRTRSQPHSGSSVFHPLLLAHESPLVASYNLHRIQRWSQP